MAKVKEKVAVVTGASSGIGESIAKKLSQQGASKFWLVVTNNV